MCLTELLFVVVLLTTPILSTVYFVLKIRKLVYDVEKWKKNWQKEVDWSKLHLDSWMECQSDLIQCQKELNECKRRLGILGYDEYINTLHK